METFQLPIKGSSEGRLLNDGKDLKDLKDLKTKNPMSCPGKKDCDSGEQYSRILKECLAERTQCLGARTHHL